jgi:hypothetical protein
VKAKRQMRPVRAYAGQILGLAGETRKLSVEVDGAAAITGSRDVGDIPADQFVTERGQIEILLELRYSDTLKHETSCFIYHTIAHTLFFAWLLSKVSAKAT